MSPDALTIIGTGIAIIVATIGLIARLRADMKTGQAEAAVDRRAFQGAMNQFRSDSPSASRPSRTHTPPSIDPVT